MVRNILWFTLVMGITLLGLSFAHEVLIVVVAKALHIVSESSLVRMAVTYLPVSPTYTVLALGTLGKIDPQGLTWTGAVIGPESTPLARFATQMTVEVIIAAFGSILVAYGLRKKIRRFWIGWGLFIQIQAIAMILRMSLNRTALEDMGVNFVVGPLTEGNSPGYEFLMATVLPVAIQISLIVVGFAPIVLTRGIVTKVKTRFVASAILGMAVMVIPGIPPYLGVASQELSSLPAPVPADAKTVPMQPVEVQQVPKMQQIPVESAPSPTIRPKPPVAMQIKPAGPRVVAVEPKPTGDRLFIDKTPATIRGVQYFFGDLVKKPPEEKERVLRRDLAIIKEVGFNAIMGWEEAGFDEQFLKLAQEYELGVIKPISLQPQSISNNVLVIGDLLDPTVRAKIKEDVARKIEQDKDSPAILMWNIGADEPIEKMFSYYRRSNEQMQGAANLILELAVLAHTIDPARAVIVSEPQDRYIGYYEDAIRKTRAQGVEPGSFFLYGGNFYAPMSIKNDLSRVKSKTASIGVGFAVTEWAPFGIDRKDRPLFRSRMGKDVMEATPVSIAYVFNPASDPMINMPDPTMAIVTGLAMTDLERTDSNGLLAALASTQNRPLFSTALRILTEDSERGFSGVPISQPMAVEEGIEQYFVGKDANGTPVTYRWLLRERTNTLVGPEIIKK